MIYIIMIFRMLQQLMQLRRNISTKVITKLYTISATTVNNEKFTLEMLLPKFQVFSLPNRLQTTKGEVPLYPRSQESIVRVSAQTVQDTFILFLYPDYRLCTIYAHALIEERDMPL